MQFVETPFSSAEKTPLLRKTKAAPRYTLGAIGGRIDLPPAVMQAACELAMKHFEACERIEFCGSAVEDLEIPFWMPPLVRWVPQLELAQLGLAVSLRSRGVRLYATVDVDEHVDDMDGLSLGLVLANDGLTFRQGRQHHCTRAGEWFIFDDRIPHEVTGTDTSHTYLVLTVALRQI